MNIEDVKQFLEANPGWLKGGANLKRLAKRLGCDREICRRAVKECKQEREIETDTKHENFVKGGTVKRVKRWQKYDGDWLESVEYANENEPSPEQIIATIKAHFTEYSGPDYVTTPHSKFSNTCAIINLFDAHIDKLCYLEETNEKSSIENNIINFENSFNDLLNQSLYYDPEVIYLPVGSDFFNSNDLSIHPTTKRGTPQSVMGSQEDSFKLGLEVYRRCIDKASKYTKVIVPMIKGNHDEDKIYYLSIALEVIYENNPNVEIDSSRHQRKYYKFGNNLFGFAHGDKEKNKVGNLPLLMAEERKQDWADTTYREWYLGDIHHKQEYKFLRGQDFIGCTVRFLRSVSTSDKWHYDAGYLGVPKTAESFIWDKNKGMIANFQKHIQ